MNIIEPEEFDKLSVDEMRDYLIDTVSSLSVDQAQELYQMIMNDEELKKLAGSQPES